MGLPFCSTPCEQLVDEHAKPGTPACKNGTVKFFDDCQRIAQGRIERMAWDWRPKPNEARVHWRASDKTHLLPGEHNMSCHDVTCAK